MMSIAWHKEPKIVATSYGINAVSARPDRATGSILTWGHWQIVNKEFPRLGLKDGVKDIICRLC